MELKILGSICFLEAVGTVGNIMGYHLGAGICRAGTSLLTVYTVYLGMEKTHKKICPECQCEIRKSYRICPECGHLFQEGLSEEQLTDCLLYTSLCRGNRKRIRRKSVTRRISCSCRK